MFRNFESAKIAKNIGKSENFKCPLFLESFRIFAAQKKEKIFNTYFL